MMLRLVVLTAAMALLAPAAGAQGLSAPPGDAELEGADVVRLDATLVEVPVVVSGPGGRYVVDLQQSEFSIREDGAPQEIALFAAVDEPISVALLLDASNSAREKLDRIKEAASAFLDEMRPHDRVSIVTFDDEVRVVSPLTSDREQLRRAIDTIQPGQFTQVYEAVYTAATEVLAGVEGRRAVILFTDGIDTASALATFDGTLEEVARRQVIVYPIRYNTRADVEARAGLAPRTDPPPPDSRPRRVVGEELRREKALKSLAQAYHVADAYLWELADRSGGVLHKADTIADLPAALAKVAAELRHQYLLGYYPDDPDRTDVERNISVSVSRPGLVVRSRQSYRAVPRQPRARR
jgi:VWFA-related protein